ncbi:lipoprotein [Salmonella phage moki]|uniref:SPFH domain band 7 family protein n=1 Tax=Salmonella phage moki TaxID=2713306 RepID=A0A6G9L9S3_9CAUD|nr:lipoprotein [Salmonella phage moki]QIQ62345.1 SPFH domain band 7 family protein [Salmonella phage moki]
MFKKLVFGAIMVLAASLLSGCGGVIDEGNVGVRTQWGEVDMNPVTAGIYTSFVSSVDVYTTKEAVVSLTKMTPKAKDNLTLEDLDVDVYYTPNVAKVPWFHTKFAGQSAELGDGTIAVGFNLVKTAAASSTMDAVSSLDSMTIHTQRAELEKMIKERTQQQLETAAPGMFTITRVLVKKALTDPSIEQSIRDNVMADKRLDTARKNVEIRDQEAKANQKLTTSLTPEYLQHEYNMVLQSCANSGKCTLIVDGSGSGKMLNVSK